MKEEAIVIGSGVGGLASAIRLAKLGYQVTVFEKNAFIGGKVHSRDFDGYRFDMGPSVFTEPELISELIALDSSQAPFEFKPLPESGRYFFEDGTRVVMPSGTEGSIGVLVNELNEDPILCSTYLERLAKNYERLHPVFIETSLHRFKHWLNMKLFPAIMSIPSYGLLTTMDRFSKRFFRNEKSIQIMNRYATYNGSDPYQTPGLLSIIGHLELNIGSFFPKGGMVSITQRLADTARSLGVHFILDAEVERILTSSGKVTGVAVDGQHYAAKVVVSNVDVHYTYKHLLPDVIKPSKILNQEMSSSAVVFYWGVESKNDSLGVHNILFSNNYRKEFEAIFKTKTLYEDPTIYIHISSKAEPSDAPSGCENWFVMVNAPINIGQDWDAMVNILREQVIQKINRNLNIDLSRLIATEFINNPVKLSQTYNGESGSIYGNSSNSTMAAFYRHPNHAPSVKGLYFAGVTVHPGGGIPLALNGAKIVERMVREDFNKRTI